MIQDSIISDDGFIDPYLIANYFHTMIEDVSYFTGVDLNTLKNSNRSQDYKSQSRLRAVISIIEKLTLWTNSDQLSYAWYRNEPVPAFGGFTAEHIVRQGNIEIVERYIEHLVAGGFT
jgi:hypothetical protein